LLERGDLVLSVVNFLALALQKYSHGGKAAGGPGNRVDRCSSFVRRSTLFGNGCRRGRRNGGSPAIAVLADVAGQLAVDIGQATREAISFGLGGGELRLQVGDSAVECVDFGAAVGQFDVQATCPVLGIGQVVFQADLVGLDGGQLCLDSVDIGGGGGGGVCLAAQQRSEGRDLAGQRVHWIGRRRFHCRRVGGRRLSRCGFLRLGRRLAFCNGALGSLWRRRVGGRFRRCRINGLCFSILCQDRVDIGGQRLDARIERSLGGGGIFGLALDRRQLCAECVELLVARAER